MGSFTSKVQAPSPPQELEAPGAPVTNVHFSPELLNKLGEEQKARMQQFNQAHTNTPFIYPVPSLGMDISSSPTPQQIERTLILGRESAEREEREAERKQTMLRENEAVKRALDVVNGAKLLVAEIPPPRKKHQDFNAVFQLFLAKNPDLHVIFHKVDQLIKH